jgi:Spy/CpxP family protein refolding chaperone
MDDRHQYERRNDQQQHGSVSETDELLDDLQSSLMAAASDYRPRPPVEAADEWSNSGRGRDGTSQISDETREREETLERLRQDLDRLLQSPKVA